MSERDVEIIMEHKDTDHNEEEHGCQCGGNCCDEEKETFDGIFTDKNFAVEGQIKTHTQLVNDTDMEFIDISSEEYREYIFPNGNTLRIDSPEKLHVSNSGGHRVFTAKGVSWYVKPSEGWAIKWVAKKDKPNFVA